METQSPEQNLETADTPGLSPTVLKPTVLAPPPVENSAPSPFQQPTSATVEAGATKPSGAPLPAMCGRYEILEEIAMGGMGAVYRARDMELGRLVALKMIRPGLVAGPEMIERFHREAQAAARLDHPNIVPIHDIGWHEGRPFFTMALVPGGNLAEKMAQFGDERRIVALVAKVTRAIHYAHENNILHRDLKPANVLLDTHGEPLVSDFGLAKLLDSNVDLTQPSQQLGTPAYMAPEQFPDSGVAVTRATDVWALGVLLFQLLTEQRPFPAKQRAELERQIRTEEPLRPRGLSLDPPLETIVLQCLRKEPTERYATAAALADELERWLRGEPILSRPEPWPRRAWRRLRRHPLLCTAAAFAAAILLAVPLFLHFTDPDRPLKQIERDLASGKEVALITDGGMPKWWSWALGDGESGKPGQAGPLLLQAGPDPRFMELVRDPQKDSYRLRAIVEHRQGSFLSEVGIYFGRHRLPSDSDVQFFCMVGFNDQRPWVRHQNGKMTSQAALQMAGSIGPDIGPYSSPVAWEYFNPGPEAPATDLPRRKLAVEVTPKGVESFWEEKSLGLVPWEKLQKHSLEVMRNLPPDVAKKMQPVAVEKIKRGGLGIYSRAGAAAFTLVELKPLK
jgi:serine/threonine-protein kinase